MFVRAETPTAFYLARRAAISVEVVVGRFAPFLFEMNRFAAPTITFLVLVAIFYISPPYFI